MRVEYRYDVGERLERLRIRPELVAAIESVSSDGVVAAGQTVKVLDTAGFATAIDGFDTVADFVAGDRVVVHGVRAADGGILATRVERGDADATGTHVAGVVAAIDRSASDGTHVRVGALDLVVGAGTVVRDADGSMLATGSLAVGDRVAAYSTADASGGLLAVSSLRRQPSAASAEPPRRVGGLIRQVLADGSFVVDAVPVDASAARFVDGTAAEIAAGRVVHVVGEASSGRLLAREVRFVANDARPTLSVNGIVSDFFSVARFAVRRTPVDASAAGVQFENGTVENLADGALVTVSGNLVGGRLVAARVRFETSPDARTTAMFGRVADYAPASGQFTLLGADAALAADAVLRFGDGSPATRSDFSDGIAVYAEGRFVSGRFLVSAATLGAGTPPAPVLEGLAFQVDRLARRLRVTGVDVSWDAQTTIVGALADLRDGRRVRVTGVASNGLLAATRLEIGPP
ncbi:MAG: DUF5666 domain-containing protein [Burkholderiaceae bacterium]